MVYENSSWKAGCIAISNRTGAVLVARSRLGQTPLLKAYSHLLDPAADPTRPLCIEEPQTVEHWLQRCPNLDNLLQRTFGSPSHTLGALITNPGEVLALARGARLNNNSMSIWWVLSSVVFNCALI